MPYLQSSHTLMTYIRTPPSYTRRSSILQVLDTISRVGNFTLTLSKMDEVDSVPDRRLDASMYYENTLLNKHLGPLHGI